MKKNKHRLHKSYNKFYILSSLIVIGLSISSFFIFDFSLEHKFLFEKIYDNLFKKSDIVAIEDIELDNQNISSYDTILKEGNEVDEEYLNDSVFIGDNKLLELSSLEILPSENIYLTDTLSIDEIENGFTNLSTNTTENIETIISNKNPKYIYLFLGNNSLSNFDSSSFFMYYNSIIDEIEYVSQNIKIVLVPIFPVTNAYSNTYLPYDVTVPKINEEILNTATKYTIYYLDYYSILSNNDGYILDTYLSEDGTTLTSEAYNLFIDYLKTHPVK